MQFEVSKKRFKLTLDDPIILDSLSRSRKAEAKARNQSVTARKENAKYQRESNSVSPGSINWIESLFPHLRFMVL